VELDQGYPKIPLDGNASPHHQTLNRNICVVLDWLCQLRAISSVPEGGQGTCR